MTATKDMAANLESWAASIASLNTFPEDPADLDQSLSPGLVVCDITNFRKVPTDGALSQFQHQQTDLRVWTARLTVMVTAQPSWDQTQALYDLTDQLERALTRDKTLGGRVESASPRVDVGFPGEVEHPSGLVALAAFFQVTVGETAEV